MSFWTPIENPGTRPPRSWVFDVGCVLFAAMASFGGFSFAQTAHPAHPVPLEYLIKWLTCAFAIAHTARPH